MSADRYSWIIPTPTPEILELFQAHALSLEFHREVKHRQELQAYGQWYRETAKQNRRELQRMRGDINIFGWFNRMRGQ